MGSGFCVRVLLLFSALASGQFIKAEDLDGDEAASGPNMKPVLQSKAGMWHFAFPRDNANLRPVVVSSGGIQMLPFLPQPQQENHPAVAFHHNAGSKRLPQSWQFQLNQGPQQQSDAEGQQINSGSPTGYRPWGPQQQSYPSGEQNVEHQTPSWHPSLPSRPEEPSLPVNQQQLPQETWSPPRYQSWESKQPSYPSGQHQVRHHNLQDPSLAQRLHPQPGIAKHIRLTSRLLPQNFHFTTGPYSTRPKKQQQEQQPGYGRLEQPSNSMPPKQPQSPDVLPVPQSDPEQSNNIVFLPRPQPQSPVLYPKPGHPETQHSNYPTASNLKPEPQSRNTGNVPPWRQPSYPCPQQSQNIPSQQSQNTGFVQPWLHPSYPHPQQSQNIPSIPSRQSQNTGFVQPWLHPSYPYPQQSRNTGTVPPWLQPSYPHPQQSRNTGTVPPWHQPSYPHPQQSQNTGIVQPWLHPSYPLPQQPHSTIGVSRRLQPSRSETPQSNNFTVSLQQSQDQPSVHSAHPGSRWFWYHPSHYAKPQLVNPRLEPLPNPASF